MMKLNGKKIEGPNVEIVYIPRGENDPLVFHCQAVLDYEEFNKMCVKPEPPMRTYKGGAKVPNYDNAEYKKQIADWGEKQSAFMFIKSISATPELEFELVNIKDPTTYDKIDEEMTSAGLSLFEISRLNNAIMAANGLSADKIEEARKTFLAGREKIEK